MRSRLLAPTGRSTGTAARASTRRASPRLGEVMRAVVVCVSGALSSVGAGGALVSLGAVEGVRDFGAPTRARDLAPAGAPAAAASGRSGPAGGPESRAAAADVVHLLC